MLDELLKMLAHPDDYECCWHDGELYLREKIDERAGTEKQKVREPEPA